MHFYSEGAAKLANPKPFSAGFLGAAKGPLAGFYKGMIWDADGLARLDLEATKQHWHDYQAKVIDHFGFDADQKERAAEIVEGYEITTKSGGTRHAPGYIDRLEAFLESKAEEIREYQLQLKRRDENTDPEKRPPLESLKTQDARITGDWMKLKGQLIPPIDKMWAGLETALNDAATEEQQNQKGRLPVGKLGRKFPDTEFVDGLIPYFDLIVGFCLIVGLFTRAAAIGGALFLASVCASQWPGSAGAAPIANQGVEMLAMLALAGVGAGRYAGMDGIIGYLCRFCCRAKAPANGGAKA